MAPRRWISLLVLFGASIGASVGTARAQEEKKARVPQIFRYVQPDGTVAYTDQLSDLPKERRAYYNRLIAEQEKKNREVERKVQSEEEAIRQAERERAELARKQAAEKDLQRRLAAMDEAIESLRQRHRARNQAKEKWQRRLRAVQTELAQKLAEYRETKKEWQALAIRADFTLFPGEGEKKQALQAQMETLQKKVDALAHELNVVIPEEARKAGVPPGWLRGVEPAATNAP